MRFSRDFSKLTFLALIVGALTGCGGGGGGVGLLEPDPNAPPTEPPATPILVNSPATLAEVISFAGGQKVSGSIPAPDSPTGGSLSVTPEIAITAGSSTPFNMDIELAEGDYVHAYLIQVEGTESTFIIPLDADGQTQSYRQIAASDVPGHMTKLAAQSLSAGQAGFAESMPARHIMSCSGSPNLQLSAEGYEALAVVQAYVQPQVPVQGAAFDLAGLQIEPQFWTTRTTTNIKAVPVGNGTLQITLTWDSTADVDLHLDEPDQNTISYMNRDSFSGDGYLDVDDIDGYGPENIFYDTEISGGTYTVKVHMFSGFGDELPTNYSLTVKRNGGIDTYNGTLVANDEEDLVTTFTMTASSSGTNKVSSSLSSVSSSSSSSSSSGTGSDLTYGSCGVVLPNIASMCFTNYPTGACGTAAESLTGTATVVTYDSISGCDGSYICDLSVESIEDSFGSIPMGCYY